MEISACSLKILIVGSNAQGSLENAYSRALKKVGVEQVEIFDLDRHRPCFHGPKIITRLLNRVTSPTLIQHVGSRIRQFLSNKGRTYDVVIVFKGMELSRSVLESCRLTQPRAAWVNVNPDDPFNIGTRGSTNSHVIDSVSFYDIYCTWSRTLLSKLKELNCRRVGYLPFGYDQDFHVPPAEPVSVGRRTISFVGTWDREREAILTELSDCDLRIFGNNWDRVSKRSLLYRSIIAHNIYGYELCQVVARNAVCLNILRSQNAGAHNMRTFEIPAMGGLMLTNRSEEQNEFFPEGEGCLMFGDIAELREQLDWAFANQEQARRIRTRGTELVRGHSYVDRAKTLLAILSDT